jgi:hypothetical protein
LNGEIKTARMNPSSANIALRLSDSPGDQHGSYFRYTQVKAWVSEGAPGVFVIDGRIDPDLEADWHAEHFP